MADYKQCRECIKQDTCTFKILKSKEIDCQYFIDKDVVPRSAYEQSQAEKDNLIATYETMMRTYAEQLFEEIEDSIAVHAYTNKSEDYADGAFDTIEWVDEKIAELKKKHIGK